MSWIDAGPVRTWASGETRSLAVGRRMVAVVRSGEEYFAIEDVCTHDGAELTGGEIEGRRDHLPAPWRAILPAHRRGADAARLRAGPRIRHARSMMDICGYAQTDAAPPRRGASPRHLRRGLRARVDAPRNHRGAGNRRAHRAPQPHAGSDPGEPRGARLDARRRSSPTPAISTPSRCNAPASSTSRPRKPPGACSRGAIPRCSTSSSADTIPGLSQVASRLGPKPQRRTLPTAGLATAVWHQRALGAIAAGDRRELRAGRPGKPARFVELGRARGHASRRELRVDRGASA